MIEAHDLYEGEILLSARLKVSCDLPALSYTLLKSEMDDKNFGKRESYTLICECGSDVAVLSDITSIKDRAVEIFRAFLNNSVTPTGAYCVIEEMI
jgi:hypothetical protein